MNSKVGVLGVSQVSIQEAREEALGKRILPGASNADRADAQRELLESNELERHVGHVVQLTESALGRRVRSTVPDSEIFGLC